MTGTAADFTTIGLVFVLGGFFFTCLLIRQMGWFLPWIIYGLSCLLLVLRRVVTIQLLQGHEELRFLNEITIPTVNSILIFLVPFVMWLLLRRTPPRG